MWRLCVQRNEPSPSLNWRYPLTMAPLTDACSLGTPRERKRDSISDRPSRGRGGTEEEASSAREMRSRRNSGTLRGEERLVRREEGERRTRQRQKMRGAAEERCCCREEGRQMSVERVRSHRRAAVGSPRPKERRKRRRTARTTDRRALPH
jgi:hypothetical protein